MRITIGLELFHCCFGERIYMSIAQIISFFNEITIIDAKLPYQYGINGRNDPYIHKNAIRRNQIGSSHGPFLQIDIIS